MNDRSRRISRRSATAVIAGAIAWPVGAGQSVAEAAVRAAYGKLVSIFIYPKTVSEIGLACGKSIGNESVTPTHLTAAIVRAVDCDNDASTMPEALRHRISERVR